MVKALAADGGQDGRPRGAPGFPVVPDAGLRGGRSPHIILTSNPVSPLSGSHPVQGSEREAEVHDAGATRGSHLLADLVSEAVVACRWVFCSGDQLQGLH